MIGVELMAACLALVFGLLVGLLGWIGSRVFQRLDALAVSVGELAQDVATMRGRLG